MRMVIHVGEMYKFDFRIKFIAHEHVGISSHLIVATI